MQKNETMLTPVYRYVFSVLDKGGIGKDSIKQLKTFKSHLGQSVSALTKSKEDFAVLDDTIEFLEQYCVSQVKGLEFWDKQLARLLHLVCNNCYNCKKCRIYYWKELGQLFLGKENDEKQARKYFPIWSLPDEVQKHLEPSLGTSELYFSKIKREHVSKFKNKFLMLKGMSSSTPAMLNNIFDTSDYVGGGFFFNWNGYGVVVDPGYSFVRNLHHYGLSVLDIRAVIITHEHIDHNNDMRLLDDLHFSVARYDGKKGNEHTIDWYMDAVSYDIASTLCSNKAGFRKEANRLHCVSVGSTIEMQAGELSVTFFPTEHIRTGDAGSYKKHTFGCHFCCTNDVQKRVITYTSDTRYFDQLLDYVKDADMVIANISGIYEDDYMQIKEKDTHLGYWGCYNLIKKCHEKYKQYPQFYFLSEFWNGKSDIRYDIVKCIKRELEEQGVTDVSIIPSETGMLYDIENCSIQCSECGQYTDCVIVKRPSGLNEKIEVLCQKCYF